MHGLMCKRTRLLRALHTYASTTTPPCLVALCTRGHTQCTCMRSPCAAAPSRLPGPLGAPASDYQPRSLPSARLLLIKDVNRLVNTGANESLESPRWLLIRRDKRHPGLRDRGGTLGRALQAPNTPCSRPPGVRAPRPHSPPLPSQSWREPRHPGLPSLPQAKIRTPSPTSPLLPCILPPSPPPTPFQTRGLIYPRHKSPLPPRIHGSQLCPAPPVLRYKCGWRGWGSGSGGSLVWDQLREGGSRLGGPHAPFPLLLRSPLPLPPPHRAEGTNDQH